MPKPSRPEGPGDLAMAKPELELRDSQGTSERARPRTIAEALRLQNRNQLAGEKMRQEGGVKRRLEFTALDAKATPFGDYDATFIEAVESRWFNLLDNISYDGYRRGRVVLRFHLTYDGRITDLEIVETHGFSIEGHRTGCMGGVGRIDDQVAVHPHLNRGA